MAANDQMSLPQGEPGPVRRVVVILGMHRSGTSAVAGCLQRLGIDFGPRLMPATEDNPRGYYEHIDLVNLHDRLLLALDRSWDDVHPFPAGEWMDEAVASRFRAEMLGLLKRDFPRAPLWGLKDPRLCRLLRWWEPLWREMNSEPLFLLVRRAPEEVATSLARREGFSRSKSHLLWLRHTLEAERFTRGQIRAFIDFRTFVADWRGALEGANDQLGNPWQMPTADESAVVSEFVDPSLMRSATTAHAPDEPPLWIKAADDALRTGIAGREAEMRAGLDHVAALVRAADPIYLPARAEIASDLRQQLEAVQRQAKWYEAEWQKARARADVARAKLEAKKLSNAVSEPE